MRAGGPAPLKRGRGAGDAPTMWSGATVAACDMAGRFRGHGAEVGDTLTGGVGLSAAGRGKQARGAGPAVAWCGCRRSCWAGRGWRGCWAGEERAAGLLARSWAEREKGRRAGLGLVLGRGKKREGPAGRM